MAPWPRRPVVTQRDHELCSIWAGSMGPRCTNCEECLYSFRSRNTCGGKFSYVSLSRFLFVAILRDGELFGVVKTWPFKWLIVTSNWGIKNLTLNHLVLNFCAKLVGEYSRFLIVFRGYRMTGNWWTLFLGGGSKHFLFLLLFGEDSHFD